MVGNDNACKPDKRGALESIASKLAPTVWRSHHFDSDAVSCRSWLVGSPHRSGWSLTMTRMNWITAAPLSPSPASRLLQFPGIP
ncbi:hypothetical protein B0D71_27895 [Pseudomonas laurylsulfativorans]|uniref:Uncharacterized protein n=1 Tax=Pseudomonas laurylsulfativorans TaxID=1943631 RepID=A0A2S3VG39_9PSED|nr:hypothetical protein B0D71_27895 [Pseudomonas laurylsulfativorans]